MQLYISEKTRVKPTLKSTARQKRYLEGRGGEVGNDPRMFFYKVKPPLIETLGMLRNLHGPTSISYQTLPLTNFWFFVSVLDSYRVRNKHDRLHTHKHFVEFR
jgi:hypothetical protein